MELLKEFAVLVGRIITIFPLMLYITLYMGKRSIGELPVFDFLIILVLGAVVGADIADPQIEHIHTAVAIVLIGVVQRAVSKLKIKYRKFGHLITFEPTIVMQEGQFIVENLKRIRYSVDNVLQMLREKNVFDISSVNLAVIEPNGNISVLKKPGKTEVTIEDLNLSKSSPSLAFPVVIDGAVYQDVLVKLNLSEKWLNQQLKNLGIKSTEEVFFASVNSKKEFQVSLKSFMENGENTLPIYN